MTKIAMQFGLSLGFTALGWLSGCTENEKLPNEAKYISDTTVMLTVSNKLSQEPDVRTLHRVAVDTESLRLVTCADYHGECDLYGEFLSTTIDVSKDGDLSSDDRARLQKMNADLKKTVAEGRALLHQAWKKRPAQ